MKDSWYGICTFDPTFKILMRGQGSKHRKACVTSYENPPKNGYHFV